MWRECRVAGVLGDHRGRAVLGPEGGQGCGRRDGIAAKGADGQACALHGFRDLAARDAVGEGEAVGDAFGHGHDVGLDIPMLDAEPVVARAAEVGLHLVDDDQTAIFPRDLGTILKYSGGGVTKPPTP